MFGDTIPQFFFPLDALNPRLKTIRKHPTVQVAYGHPHLKTTFPHRRLPCDVPHDHLRPKHVSPVVHNCSLSSRYGGFLKCWVSPTTMGFPTKNDHFGCFGGTTI